MELSSNNYNLNSAKRSKNDEFYTQMDDIVKELSHYEKHFIGKSIFLNCDDPEASNFWKYFEQRFEKFELTKLVAICYDSKKPTHKHEMFGPNHVVKTLLMQNGDFRSSESQEVMRESDLIITNPPFSLFREYLAQVIQFDKKFLILGNQNAVTYKEIFPLIMENKVWLGVNNGAKTYKLGKTDERDLPAGTFYKNGEAYAKLGNTSWFTNLEHDVRNQEIQLSSKYNKDDYPNYDNYNAIEIGKVSLIPYDYCGIMGVPVTYLTKHNPSQFEIVGCSYQYGDKAVRIPDVESHGAKVDGKDKYKRLFIKRK